MPKKYSLYDLVVGPGEPDNEKFGKRLETYRAGAQLTRAQAAHILGITSEYLRLIERGKRTPALGSMSTILTAYNIEHKVGVDSIQMGSGSLLVIVRFTSRIREARDKPGEIPSAKMNRDLKIGQIVRLLTSADDSTLSSIYNNLRRES